MVNLLIVIIDYGIGPDVMLTVKEVKQIEDDPDSGKPAPIIVSYVNMNNTCKLSD